jgi:hypothetical protein
MYKNEEKGSFYTALFLQFPPGPSKYLVLVHTGAIIAYLWTFFAQFSQCLTESGVMDLAYMSHFQF